MTQDLAEHSDTGRRRRIALVAVVLGIALFQRCLTMVVMAWQLGPSALVEALMQFDSVWYRGIVEQGYYLAGQDGHELSNLAFFPLYPGLAKILSIITGASATTALLSLAFAGSVVAAWPIFVIGRRLHSLQVGLILMLLWGASPQSFVLVMGYPEGWFTAATAWSLLFILQRRPLSAALAVVAAGLLRPSALPLVLVVMIWCMVQWRREENHSLRWLGATVIAPLGVGSFLIYTAWRMDDVFAYFAVQKQWDLQMSGPWAFWEQTAFLLTNVSGEQLVAMDIYVPIVVGYAVLLVILLGWWQKAQYGWMVFYTLLASLLILSRDTYFWSESRQFLPLFPLLLPLATIRTASWAWAAVLLGLTLATASFGGYFLASMGYSP